MGNRCIFTSVNPRKLSGDPETFVRLLKEIRKIYMENQGEQDQNLRIQKKSKEEQEAKMERLIDSLADLKEEESRRLVEKRIKRLGEEICGSKERMPPAINPEGHMERFKCPGGAGWRSGKDEWE